MFYFQSAFSILLVTVLGLCEAVPPLRALDVSGNYRQLHNNSEIVRLNDSTPVQRSSLECLQTLENDKLLKLFQMDTEFGGRNSSIALALKRNNTLSAAANLKQPWEPHNITLLHIAAMAGKRESVRCLLNEGMAVDTVDEIGNTPLFYAAFFGNLDTVKLLVESNACVWCKNKQGIYPIQNAGFLGPLSVLYRRDVLNYLQEKMLAQRPILKQKMH